MVEVVLVEAKKQPVKLVAAEDLQGEVKVKKREVKVKTPVKLIAAQDVVYGYGVGKRRDYGLYIEKMEWYKNGNQAKKLKIAEAKMDEAKKLKIDEAKKLKIDESVKTDEYSDYETESEAEKTEVVKPDLVTSKLALRMSYLREVLEKKFR